MNIWLITIGEVLPIEENEKKLRTALLADKLVERGHFITWWTSAFNHFKKKWIFEKDEEIKIKDGFKIVALKGTGYKKNISLSRFIDHRVLASKFIKYASQMTKPDIIVASMPPHDLAYEAVMFAKDNNIPIVVDIRDPWPDLFLEHVSSNLRWLGKRILFRDFQKIRMTMQSSHSLIAVSNTFLDWGLKYANREKNNFDKVFYLGGVKRNYTRDQSKRILKYIERYKNKFIITFIGTFAHYHNPSILIDCAKKLSHTNVQFIIAGDGEYFNDIQRRAVELDNVLLSGWLELEDINTLLGYSHIGVCPTNLVVDLFPNKAFTYLSAGLPIISAFQGDLKKIIEQYEIGFYYPPNDVDSLRDCILQLYNNQFLYKKMSANAKRVFNEMFDADKVYDKYAMHIEKVALSMPENILADHGPEQFPRQTDIEGIC